MKGEEVVLRNMVAQHQCVKKRRNVRGTNTRWSKRWWWKRPRSQSIDQNTRFREFGRPAMLCRREQYRRFD